MNTLGGGSSGKSNDYNKLNKNIKDIGQIGSNSFSLYNSLANGSSAGGGYLGTALGLLRGGHKAFTDKDKMQGGFGNFMQGTFGIDDGNDSEVMQSIKGTINGAMMGTAIFPVIGTIIGGALGLGSSFLDDI